MSDILDTLEALLAQSTPGDWTTPHIAKKRKGCDCGYIFGGHMGAICKVFVERHRHGHDDWQDNPPPRQAEANGKLIALSHNHLAALIAVARAARSYRAAEDYTPQTQSEAWDKPREIRDARSTLDAALARLKEAKP